MIKVWVLLVMAANQSSLNIDAAVYKTKEHCEADQEKVVKNLSKSFKYLKAACVEREVIE